MKKIVSVLNWAYQFLFEDEERQMTIKQGMVLVTLFMSFFVSSMLSVYASVTFGYQSMLWHYVNMSLMLASGLYMLGMSVVNRVKIRPRPYH